MRRRASDRSEGLKRLRRAPCGTGDGCCSSASSPHPSDIAAIVAHYIANYRDRAVQELRFFAIQRTLREAIRKAGRAEGPGGKRLAHQHRLSRSVLAECVRYLEASLKALTKARAFEELHEIVREEIGGIRGVGRLMVYDTALRIAAWRRLEPRRVLLHAGTRVGARRLGLDAKADSLAMADFPAALRRLRPREVEDVLCIYKDDLPPLS